MLVSARVLPNSTLIGLICSRPRTRLARGAQEGAKSRLQYLSRKLIQKKVPLLAQFGKKRQCPACVSDDSKQVLMHCLRVSYRNVEQEIRKLFRRRSSSRKRTTAQKCGVANSSQRKAAERRQMLFARWQNSLRSPPI